MLLSYERVVFKQENYVYMLNVIFFLNVLSLTLASEQCEPGSYQPQGLGSGCLDCPAGKYQDMPGATACIECIGKNEWNDQERATECKQCANGTVSPYGVASIVCETCLPNTFRTAPLTECQTCPNGYTWKDVTQCIECPAFATAAEPCCAGSAMVNGSCQLCDFGTYLQDGECLSCPTGATTSTLGSTVCEQCVPGRGVNVTSKRCDPCRPGTYSDTGVCTNCANGTYQTETDQSACFSCPDGPWTYVDSVTPCIWSGDVCDEGEELANGTCTQCSAGKFRSRHEKSCTSCPEQSISTSSLIQCVSCPAGKTSFDNTCVSCAVGKTRSSFESECTSCPKGRVGDNGFCSACPKGTFQNTEEILATTQCKECPSGFRSPGDIEACFSCTPGRGSSDPVSDRCIECAAGRYSFQGTNGCQNCNAGLFSEAQSSICRTCPRGYMSETRSETCTICPTGFYSNPQKDTCLSCNPALTNLVGAGSWECDNTFLRCGAGWFGETRLACQECPAGYSSGIQQESCDECPGGTIAPPGATECVECAPGTQPSANTCENCTAGRYGAHGVCHLCPKGKYQSQEGKDACTPCQQPSVTGMTSQSVTGMTSQNGALTLMTTPAKGATSQVMCIPCQNGELALSENGDCKFCEDDEYPKHGTCTLCPLGWQNILRQHECTKCPVGKATWRSNQRLCFTCPAGFIAPAKGQAECTSCQDLSDGCVGCSAGFYSSAVGCSACAVGRWSESAATECSLCPRGTYQPYNAQSKCLNCPIGKYTSEVGSSFCKLCQPGKFQEFEQSAICYDCPVGRYSLGLAITCQRCVRGKTTPTTGSASNVCVDCAPGFFEVDGRCESCPESTYQDEFGAFDDCKKCPDHHLSPQKSTRLDQCFEIEDLKSYVFGIKGDTKTKRTFETKCELRPNAVLLCPYCTCDDDSRNGFWSSPICDECRRGFATEQCTVKCPMYDGEHDSTMCSGNGMCWFGKRGNGLCYCGGKHSIDPTGENVVVDVRVCPRGKICPGHGIEEQEETSYKPFYYLMAYRQYSVFILQLNKYTPNRGHMWFKRYPPNNAYENTCSSCVGPFKGTSKTIVGYWDRQEDWRVFPSARQTFNGFHGENCQHECALCLNGGRCNNAPHPYRHAYTIEDTFEPQRAITIASTTCVCSSVIFDSEQMCCPNGFQPYVYQGNRWTTPYSRFTRVPHLTSIINRQMDYHISTDVWLSKETPDMIENGMTFRPTFYEPSGGNMIIVKGVEQKTVPYAQYGPYNNHVYYGSTKDICRACPGLFGKGVVSQSAVIDTEEKAESFWWDNSMGASAKKCNGVGVCDFYAREREPDVAFMGSVDDYRRIKRGHICSSQRISRSLRKSRHECIEMKTPETSFIAFSEPYMGGTTNEMLLNSSGSIWSTNIESEAAFASQNAIGYAQNRENGMYVLLNTSFGLPKPDSDSVFTVYPKSMGTCILFKTCEGFTYQPHYNVYSVHVGRGSDRAPEATFDRFDTCFTYQTQEKGMVDFGLFATLEYENGKDPFLGGNCPKGHFCTQVSGVSLNLNEKIGYKEACPAGYYQPYEGVHRTVIETQCSATRVSDVSGGPPDGCQWNLATKDPHDLVDLVCKRCPRPDWSAPGSATCTECPQGRVKKISGTFDPTSAMMMNIPSFLDPGVIPWYYIEDELGQEASDCALMPPSIIHIPLVNHKMRYEVPTFLSAVSCPFGLSTPPGTFMFPEYSEGLEKLFSPYKESTTAPFISFEPMSSFSLAQDKACHCLDAALPKVKINKLGECQLFADSEERTLIRLSDGPPGCWTYSQKPGFAFFVLSEGKSVPSPYITNVCTDGEYRTDLVTKLIGQYCKTCPGNSVTGPETGTCSTCFGNQLKSYMKEAIHKISTNSYDRLITCEDQQDCENKQKLPKESDSEVSREDYLVDFVPWKLRNFELDTENEYWSCDVSQTMARYERGQQKMTLANCFIGCVMNTVWKLPEDRFPVANDWDVVGHDDNYCYCSRNKSTCVTEEPQQPDGIRWFSKKDANGTSYRDWATQGMPLCATCSAGQYFKVDKCAPCQPGKYTSTASEANAVSCKQCPMGWIQPSFSGLGCVECESGKYQDVKQGKVCKLCALGMFQNTPGKRQCVSCPQGWTTHVQGRTLCSECSAGRYGVYNVTGSTCQDCPIGFYQDTDGSNECKECIEGRYSNIQKSIECLTCGQGTFQDRKGRTSQNDCKSCDIGTFSAEHGRATVCDTCATGRYANVPRSISCVDCPGGRSCSERGEGSVCGANTYAPEKTWPNTGCQTCAPDTFDKYVNFGQTECLSCKDHHYVNNQGVCQLCGDRRWFGTYTGSGLDIYIYSETSPDEYFMMGMLLSKESQTVEVGLSWINDHATVTIPSLDFSFTKECCSDKTGTTTVELEADTLYPVSVFYHNNWGGWGEAKIHFKPESGKSLELYRMPGSGGSDNPQALKKAFPALVESATKDVEWNTRKRFACS